MAISSTDYRLARLVGIGHYSRNYREIARESRLAMSARDPWMVAAAIHNVGHIARRFGIIDWRLVSAAQTAAGRNAHQQMVRFALNDMRADIATYMPFRRYLSNLSDEREFEAD